MSQSATTGGAGAAPAPRRRRLDRLALLVRFQSVIGLVVVAIGGVIFSPRRHGAILFLQPDNMANIVRAVSETGIIAVGMTFVIITAGIDLSVGALLSLCSVLTATIMTTAGWGLIPTVLFVNACGAAFGAAQGTISNRFRLEPFNVTLAGLQVARGLALVISNNQYINISYGNGPGLAPPVFAILGDRLFNNIVPVATLVFVVVAVIATFVLNFTRFGR
jgi:ribose transport system permease protein